MRGSVQFIQVARALAPAPDSDKCTYTQQINKGKHTNKRVLFSDSEIKIVFTVILYFKYTQCVRNGDFFVCIATVTRLKTADFLFYSTFSQLLFSTELLSCTIIVTEETRLTKVSCSSPFSPNYPFFKKLNVENVIFLIMSLLQSGPRKGVGGVSEYYCPRARTILGLGKYTFQKY